MCARPQRKRQVKKKRRKATRKTIRGPLLLLYTLHPCLDVKANRFAFLIRQEMSVVYSSQRSIPPLAYQPEAYVGVKGFNWLRTRDEDISFSSTTFVFFLFNRRQTNNQHGTDNKQRRENNRMALFTCTGNLKKKKGYHLFLSCIYINNMCTNRWEKRGSEGVGFCLKKQVMMQQHTT